MEGTSETSNPDSAGLQNLHMRSVFTLDVEHLAFRYKFCFTGVADSLDICYSHAIFDHGLLFRVLLVVVCHKSHDSPRSKQKRLRQHGRIQE